MFTSRPWSNILGYVNIHLHLQLRLRLKLGRSVISNVELTRNYVIHMTATRNEALLSGVRECQHKNHESYSKHVGHAGRCAGTAIYEDAVPPSSADLLTVYWMHLRGNMRATKWRSFRFRNKRRKHVVSFLFYQLRKWRARTTVWTVGQISVITANITNSRYIY